MANEDGQPGPSQHTLAIVLQLFRNFRRGESSMCVSSFMGRIAVASELWSLVWVALRFCSACACSMLSDERVRPLHVLVSASRRCHHDGHYLAIWQSGDRSGLMIRHERDSMPCCGPLHRAGHAPRVSDQVRCSVRFAGQWFPHLEPELLGHASASQSL